MASKRLVALTDRAVLRVAGAGSGHFLQGLCTQDVQQLAGRAVLPAAFLSAKGKVLCDTLIQRLEPDEFLVDCHSSVAASLRRLLIRHKLRQPLAIEDVSAGYQPTALLPAAGEPEGGVEGYWPDPRFAKLGHRAILANGSGAASALGALWEYHSWRVRCGVPEGPQDMKLDEVMPLHVNLDLLNFVSFNKGCYVGQELLTRTKHRGAVRRRVFTSIAVEESQAAEVQERLRQLPPGSPLTPDFVAPLKEEPEMDAAVMCRKGHGDAKQVGSLLTVSQNIGLCLLRCEAEFNEPHSFKAAPLSEDAVLETAGLRVFVRAPPYVF